MALVSCCTELGRARAGRGATYPLALNVGILHTEYFEQITLYQRWYYVQRGKLCKTECQHLVLQVENRISNKHLYIPTFDPHCLVETFGTSTPHLDKLLQWPR